MKSILFICLTVLLLASAGEAARGTRSAKEYQSAFTNWAQNFIKSYTTGEFFKKFQQFKDNYDFIHDWNSGGHSSSCAENEFTDLSSTEYSQLLGYVPDARSKRFMETGFDHDEAEFVPEARNVEEEEEQVMFLEDNEDGLAKRATCPTSYPYQCSTTCCSTAASCGGCTKLTTGTVSSTTSRTTQNFITGLSGLSSLVSGQYTTKSASGSVSSGSATTAATTARPTTASVVTTAATTASVATTARPTTAVTTASVATTAATTARPTTASVVTSASTAATTARPTTGSGTGPVSPTIDSGSVTSSSGTTAVVSTTGGQTSTGVDWRTAGIVGPIKNQGSCGSCWTFGAAGAIESAWAKAKGSLVQLSEQQLVDCYTSSNGCNGGDPAGAMRYVFTNKGIDTMASYPYEMASWKSTAAVRNTCRATSGVVGATLSGGSQGVTSVSATEAALQAAADKAVISVAIDAGQSSFQSYKSGIYNDAACSSSSLNHAVLVVGYGTNSSGDYWIVKNSWGASWGSAGYIYIARNQGNRCGIAARATYPVV